MLAGLKRDLQRSLRPGPFWVSLWLKLKRFPIGDPALDFVHATFAAQPVEGLDILEGYRKWTIA